ncbi:G domain-containing protein [Trichostrongylus colubriformis]|uniref:G domain-containing protein n=1 Tax=Trichostrongylus colubriformis TaxID=6319 RepID=A0AAN8FHD9_TRICO
MTGTPPLSEQLPRINKFVGEAFEEKAITRTIFVSSEEDTTKKDSRVILLIGPQTARKTSLIDFLCNYFYGAELDQPTRYHIANEKFDSTTPEKQIITYVFNDAKMDFRPVVIDTPSTSGPHGEENRRLLEDWLKDNKMKIDAIGIVFSAHSRLTSTEEEGLQKAIIPVALQLIPPHLAEKRIVFMTGSDGSSPPVGLLRRSCEISNEKFGENEQNPATWIENAAEYDPLQEHLRGNYWRMSVTNFEALFSRLKYEQPLSHLIRRYDIPPAESLESTQSSQDTFVQLFKGTSEDSARKPFDVLQNTTTENSVSPEKSDSRMSSKASDRVREISTEEAITTLSGGSTTATRRLPDAKMTEQRSSLSSSAFVPPGNASKLKAWSHLDTRGSVGGATATTNGITSSLPSAAATDPSHELQPQLESSTKTRYVYEVSSKSHKKHYVGPGSVEDPSATSRKIGSVKRSFLKITSMIYEAE